MSKLLFDIDEDTKEEEIKEYFCSNCDQKFPKDVLVEYRRKYYCSDCLEEVKEKSKRKKDKPIVEKNSELEKLRKEQELFQEQQLAAIHNIQEIISQIQSLPKSEKINQLEREIELLKVRPILDVQYVQKDYETRVREFNDLEIVTIQKKLRDLAISDKKKLKEAYRETKIFQDVQKEFQKTKFKTDLLKLVLREAIKDISKIIRYFSIEIFRSWLIDYGLEKDFWNIFTKNLRGDKAKKLELIQAIIDDLNYEDKIQLIWARNNSKNISSFNSMFVIRILFRIQKGNRRELADFAAENKELFNVEKLTRTQILTKITHGLDQLKNAEIIHKGIYGYILGRE
ncbi:MAG: hypothetical protein ACFFCM_21800 [Promethearchaeota archaeon]